MKEVNYHVRRGEVFERLIVPKERRTRRRRVPTEVAATILVEGISYVLPASITSEGAVRLYLAPENTEWLPVGVYPWDLAIVVSRSRYYTSTQLEQVLAAYGTLTVTNHVNLTPMYVDGVVEPLEELLP